MTTGTKILIGAGAIGITGTALYFILKPKSEPQSIPDGTKPNSTGSGGGNTGGGGTTPKPVGSPQYVAGTTVYAKDTSQSKAYKGVKVRKKVTDGIDAYKAYVGEEIGTTTGRTQVVDGTLFSEISVKTVWGLRPNPFGGSGNKVWVADMFLANTGRNTVYEFAVYLFDEVTGLWTDEDGIYIKAKSICRSDYDQLKEIFTVRYSVQNFEKFIKDQAPNLDVTKMMNSFSNC